MKLELRLSEAIMLGRLTIDCPNGGDIGACAIAMALNAAGKAAPVSFSLDWVSARYEAFAKEWPWLDGMAGKNCPFCGVVFGKALSTTCLVPHIFDLHVMFGEITIEQLCDYVRSIEPAEPSISILPSRQPLVRIPEGSDQGDEQPEWDDTDTSRELYSGIQRGCQ